MHNHFYSAQINEFTYNAQNSGIEIAQNLLKYISKIQNSLKQKMKIIFKIFNVVKWLSSLSKLNIKAQKIIEFF